MYELVTFPEVQQFMEHPEFRQSCYLLSAFADQEYAPDSAYFVPIWLYKEVTGIDPIDIHIADVD